MATKLITQQLLELQKQVSVCLDHYLSIANHKLATNYVKPKATYRKKGTVAGTAHLQSWMIQINTELLLEHKEAFIDEIVPHELAHLLAFKYFAPKKIKPHGNEWRWMMSEILNKQPLRTHAFISPANKLKKQYIYQCKCQQHNLSKIRHNRISQNKMQYVCKKCGNALDLLPFTP